MATITARVDDWLDEEIRRFWEERGCGPSTGFRRVAEEWWTVRRFPRLEFRDGVTGRRCAIRGGPDVWEVAMVARELGDRGEALRTHFGDRVEPRALEEALKYAGLFPDRIDAMIAENRRVERTLSRDGGG